MECDVYTRSYFTDTETSGNNTFETGTINIDIDGNYDWQKAYELKDMKPSQTDYIRFVINNTGTNPVNVIKKLININTTDGAIPEAECLEGL